MAAFYGMESNREAGKLWDQVRQDKAAGGYPWTHLTHPQDEEVWLDPLCLPQDISRETIRRKDGTIPPEWFHLPEVWLDPLCLPQDISRETIRRKDGTIPPEWFHLPEGATPPTVDDLLREDSTEEDDQDDEEEVQKAMSFELSSLSCGRKTPTGRRTPVCGRHRNRHKSKSSGGSSPAPSQRSEPSKQSEHHNTNLEVPSTRDDGGGYEPVGQSNLQPGDRPETRSPRSQLPSPPSGEETDTTQGCFPLLRTRANLVDVLHWMSSFSQDWPKSKERKRKKSVSASSPHRKGSGSPQRRESGCSEHNYETPKLMLKSPGNKALPPPLVDRNMKPQSTRSNQNDQEDGYEPIGRDPSNLQMLITQNSKDDSDADTRNITRRIKDQSNEPTKKEVVTDNNEFEDVELIHLQRNISDKSIQPEESNLNLKEAKRKKKEEERQLREQQKQEKIAKDKEEKKRLREEKKLIEKAKSDKIKEEKILKDEEREKKKRDEDENRRLQKVQEEEKKREMEDEKKKKLEEQRQLKLQKQKEIQVLKDNEEEKKKIKEQQRKEEKERKILAKAEKEKQAKELKAHVEEEKKKKYSPELDYADEELHSLPPPSPRDITEDAKDEEWICIPSASPIKMTSGECEYEQVGAARPPTSEMSLRPRTPVKEDGKYVSVVSNDEFATFRKNGNGVEHDEEIDFTPQNGYEVTEEMDYQEDSKTVRKPSRKSKPDLMGKIAAAGSAIKKARLPTAVELKEGYLNSAFHKSLHQPLIVKSKVEKEEVRMARQALTEEKSPAQLGNIQGVGDIPIPKVFHHSENNETEAIESKPMPKNMEEWGQAAFNTLPKSMREQNIITAVKENLDPEELARNQTLTKTKTPAELSQIHSLAEFPVPDRIMKFISSEKKEEAPKKEPKKRRHSVTEEETPNEPFSLYSTLPRSLRETKLITNIKVEEDDDVLRARQELVQSKSPAELSAICSIGDIPLPSKLTKIMGGRAHEDVKPQRGAPANGGGQIDTSSSKTPSKMNLNDMYSTLPKAFTMELAVKTKIEDQALVEQRMKLTQERTPMELGNIGSISDLPIPEPITNLFKTSVDDTPTKPRRKNLEEKRKRNLTTGTFLSADYLPQSWCETKLICSRKVEEDPEVLKAHQELVAGKSVSELGQIHGIEDFPVPARIQTLIRKKRVLKSTEEKESMRSGITRSLTSISTKSLTSLSFPESLMTPLAVKSVVEDQDLVARNKEIIKTKSVTELSRIDTFSDFPVPENIENLYKRLSAKPERSEELPTERPKTPGSLKDTIYETLPRSLRETQLLCNSKFEDDEERLRERQELTRTKSPTELSQISSVSEFPLPTPIENLLKKKSDITDSTESPVPPPRKWRQEDIYDSIPASLKSELIVKSVIEDPVEAASRMELTRTHTPGELSQIHGIADLPVPTFIENLMQSKKDIAESTEKEAATEEDKSEKGPFKIYDTLPASLRETKLVCSATVEDPEIQAARAEVVKSKSVHELSQVTGLTDFPIPDTIENFVRTLDRKQYAPAERRKKIKEQTKSKSTQSLTQGLYDSMIPSSLKQELSVKTLEQDPELVAKRQTILATKSISELSKVTSISDFPIPTPVSKLFHKSMEALNGLGGQPDVTKSEEKRPVTPVTKDSIYATLPKSLKSELLVSSCVEDPEVVESRRELVASKSVSELSQIRSLSEFPLPETLEKLLSGSGGGEEIQDADQSSRPPTSLSAKGLKEEMYASLPRSLKDQLLVRTKVEASGEELQARQALVESKSPLELSEIHSFSEMPIPSRIEAWLSGNQSSTGSQGGLEDSPLAMPRNKKELQEVFYRGLPASLTQPVVVRSKVEDPTTLLERQQVQQTKSIHELSKIRNLNEFPIPCNLITMPDVPLPKMKDLLNIVARPPPRSSPKSRTPKSETYHSFASDSETNQSTPMIEERNIIKEDEERYEELEDLPVPEAIPVQEKDEEEEEEDQFSLAEQIRATPERSLKKEKKKKNRRSTDSSTTEDVQCVSSSTVKDEEEEIPPPLPPKRITPSPKKGMSLESQPSLDEEIEPIPVKGILSLQAIDGNIRVVRNEIQSQPREMTEKANTDPVQSRPLPAPPAPPRNLKKNKSVEDSDGRSSRTSGTASPSCYRDIGDATITENFRTCQDTLPVSRTLVDSANRPQSSLSSDVTLADSCVDSLVSCADTLIGDNDTLETCAETLCDEDQTQYFSDDDPDNPYPSVDFDSMMAQGPGAGAAIVDRPGRSVIKKSESGRRLEEGTQQLSLELMEHVESLKTTLDNMSSRLGTRSRSRSQSKTRPSSQYRPSDSAP